MGRESTGGVPAFESILVAACAVALLVALHVIFAATPVERQMGIVQKIFYFHVPGAYAMYLCFLTCAVASGLYLAFRRELHDAVAVAGAEVGALFCVIVLVTGPLWARKAWGVYWTWDPRLTTTLLAGMIFFAYLVLRSLGESGEVERRFAAGLAVLGALNIPVIHFSVGQWRGAHPTVISEKGGGIAPEMVPALALGFVLFTLLALLLIVMRVRAERLTQTLRRVETDAAESGLLEESDA
jgi:heme exporter protein C